MALELVSEADFGCVLHHFSSWTRLRRSRGQVRPGNAEKTSKLKFTCKFPAELQPRIRASRGLFIRLFEAAGRQVWNPYNPVSRQIWGSLALWSRPVSGIPAAPSTSQTQTSPFYVPFSADAATLPPNSGVSTTTTITTTAQRLSPKPWREFLGATKWP